LTFKIEFLKSKPIKAPVCASKRAPPLYPA